MDLALAQGDIARLETWVSSAAQVDRRASPGACAVRAWVLLAQGLKSDAVRWLARADEASSGASEGDGLVLAVRTYFALYEGQSSEAVKLGEAALGRLGPRRVSLRAWVLSLLSVAHLVLRNRDESVRLSTEASVLAERTDVDLLSPILYAGWQRIQCGELTGAERAYQHALTVASPEGMEPLAGAALVHTMLASTAYERDDRDEAWRHADAAVAIAEKHGQVQARMGGLVMQARLHAAEGNLRTALESALEASRFAASLESCRALPEAVVAELHSELGDWERALVWVSELDAPGRPSVAPGIEDMQSIAAARVLLRAGRSREALERLRPAIASTRQAPGGLVVAVLATWARVQVERGEEDEALSALSEAVRRASVHGHVRSIVDAGPELASLVRRLLDGVETAAPGFPAIHARRISRAFERTRSDAPGAPIAMSLDPKVRLTPRECEVLQLVVDGLSNKQIAGRLGTRVGTVKKQISTILWKTGAANRTHAAALARTLALVPTEDRVLGRPTPR